MMILVLVIGTLSAGSFAATADIAVKTDRESYLQGDTVKAQVYIPGTLNKLAAMDLVLSYDSSKLQLVKVTDGEGLDNAINAQENGRVYSKSTKTIGKVKWSLAATSNFTFKGVFAEIEFTIKKSAPGGDCTLALSFTSAANSGYVDMKSSMTVNNVTFEIIKDAANDLIYEISDDKRGYEVVAYHSATIDNITIPASYAGLPVIGIADGALANHAEFKTIILPETIEYIGVRAFNGCSGIETLVIPDSVNTIDTAAFMNCTALKNVTLPIGLEKIEDNLFNGCTALEKIEIPFTVKSIGAGAFENCYVLNSVKISKNTTNIASTAFYNCLYEQLEFRTVEGNTYLPTYIESKTPGAKITLIKDLSLGTANVTENQAYTGKALTPNVTVTLDSGARVSRNSHYKVVYKNNTERGTATVYVAGLGDYGEGYILHFTISCSHKDVEKVLAKEAACITDGYYRCKCKLCGESYQEAIPATGHTEGEWIIDLRPTITKTGFKHTQCVKCGAIIQNAVEIPKAFPDLNNDKRINSSDALIVLQYVTEKANYLKTQELLLNADTNGDGKINSSDALIILQISIGKTVIEGYTV